MLSHVSILVLTVDLAYRLPHRPGRVVLKILSRVLRSAMSNVWTAHVEVFMRISQE